MGDLTSRIAGLSPEKRALLEKRLRQSPAAGEGTSGAEPLAIVGVGCRFPGGARTPEAFWRVIAEGVDAISETPRDRWNLDELYDPDASAPGKVTTRWGGFIDGVDQFDAALFGIAPREAAQMDPQQRLLLETAWDALEHAGQSADRLKGTRTGVFVGAHSHSADYCLMQYGDLDRLDMFSGTGTSHNFLSGRLSYLLDLRGPSVSLDTACSSSLVAAHLACQSIRAGECSMAIVAGVNLMLTPHFTVAASRMHMLSPSGRCKAFDAGGDGFVRSEGCGVVVIKRLSDAVAEGDRILAVVRGSAVNQDGRTNGITAPNGLSQQDVIREALKNAGVDAQDVGYVEAHGTGTPLGDPIEVEALASTVGQPRGDGRTVALGSVKSNIGHVEGGAGVAGLIKAALCLHHRQLPPLVHFRRLNPHISLEGSALRIPTALEPWTSDRPRIAGVSSFGWSGTNAHVVLEEAPEPAHSVAAAQEPPRSRVIPMSARTPEALDALARAWGDWCQGAGAGADITGVCDTAARRRAHHEHRAAIVALSMPELTERLAALIGGEAHPDVVLGHTEARAGVVFVFPGQGSQWLGMGRELYGTEPVFRQAIDGLDAALARYVDWSLVKELQADDASSNLARIDVVQPVLFAVEVALAALWRARGFHPDAVVGHSMGEVAAALVAGALSLDDAARVITARSQLLRRISGRGGMAVVELSMEETSTLLAPYAGRLSIAVSNSPTSTVISGDADAVAEVVAALDEKDIFCRRINVDVASHSPHVDPLGPDLLRSLDGLGPAVSIVPFYSTVTAQVMDAAGLDPRYWVRNLREPVLMARTVAQLAADGNTTFIEMSPHPVLLQPIETTLRALNQEGLAVPSLRRQESERGVMLASAARLYVAGYGVDWTALNGPGPFVEVPRYCYQRERFWLESEPAGQPAAIAAVSDAHPILTAHVDPADRPGSRLWQVALDPRRLRYLLDHRLDGTPVLSASVTLELALAAAAHLYGDGPVSVRDFELIHPLVLSHEGPSPVVQVSVAPRGEREADLLVFALEPGGARLLGRAIVAAGAAASAGAPPPLDNADAVPADQYYQQLEARGVSIGDGFRTIASLVATDGSVDASLALAENAGTDASRYRCHPALTDGLLQLLPATIDPRRGAHMTTGCREVRWYRHPGLRGSASVRSVDTTDDRQLLRDLSFADESGPVLELLGLQLRSVESTAAGRLPERIDRWLHEIEWRDKPRAQQSEVKAPLREGHWLVFADGGGVGDGVADWLTRKGQRVTLVRQGSALVPDGAGFVLGADRAEDYSRLLAFASGQAEASCRGVVFLWPLDVTEPRDAAGADRACEQGCGAALHLVRALGRHDWAQAPRLWIVTRGAQGVSAPAGASPWQGALWGLGRVVEEEHRELFGGLIDIDPAAPLDTTIGQLGASIWESDGEPEVAWRDGRRLVPRLVAAPRDTGPAIACRADATYVVTGAFGGIGVQLARWLVEQGARRLIVTGRMALPPRAEWVAIDPASPAGRRVATIRALEALGASVHVASFDLSDEAAASAYFGAFAREGWPAIRGVVHCAAVTEDRLLATTDTASLLNVLRPKAVGAWVLDRVLDAAALDFFVSFSSLGSLIGQPGQGSYAAANAFLDTFAARQRARGVRAVAVNWAGWRGLGFADTEGGRRTVDALEASGIGSFEARDAFLALRMILASGSSQVAVVPADWARVRRARSDTSELRLIDELGREVESAAVVGGDGVGRAASFAATVAAAAGDDRRELVEKHLQEQLAQVLRLPASRLDPVKPLGALGLESLMALEFRNRLERSLGVKLSATLVWNHPTIRALATYLLGRLAEATPAPGATAPEAILQAAVPGPALGELTEEEALRALLEGQS